MAKVCAGSHYGSDWAVYTAEDARACVDAGGRVVEQSGGVCGSSAAARMAVPDGANAGRLAELALASFREVRQRAGAHEFVAGLVELNSRLGPVIEAMGERDAELRARIADGFLLVGGLAAAMNRGEADAVRLPAERFEKLEALALELAQASGDPDTQRAVDRAIGLGRRLVDRDLSDVGRELFGPAEPPGVVERWAIGDLITVQASQALAADRWLVGPSFIAVLEELRAVERIGRKAAELGWTGSKAGDMTAVSGGWRQSYEHADIYVGDGDAFEVHGDIRAKYNALGGPAAIGLPVTDETGTPDGIGRYNHFAGQASIYWTPSTGPKMVRGRVRQAWADSGWERGPVGYPVTDQRSMPPFNATVDNPNLGWCVFENGAMFSVAGAGAQATEAEITPVELRSMVRSFFDQRLKAASSDLGLEAQTDVLGVSGWGYGFWDASPRTITFRVHGFHSNPIIADTTFTIEVRFRFWTARPALFTYPTDLSLVVTLEWLRVRASGAGSGTLASRVSDGVWKAFWRGGPEPGRPEVPDGAVFLASFPTGASQRGQGGLDVIDVITTAQGGLKVLLNPLPPAIGGLRRGIAQSRIDAFLGK
jgi:hypothetical protein